MKAFLSLISALALLGALLMGARRYRCTCRASSALAEAEQQLALCLPPDDRRVGTAHCEKDLELTRLGRLGFEVESSGTTLPQEFWGSLLNAAEILNHPDWPELIRERIEAGQPREGSCEAASGVDAQLGEMDDVNALCPPTSSRKSA